MKFYLMYFYVIFWTGSLQLLEMYVTIDGGFQYSKVLLAFIR